MTSIVWDEAPIAKRHDRTSSIAAIPISISIYKSMRAKTTAAAALNAS
jgi:hypothetical protein